jgi:hypothetical protein
VSLVSTWVATAGVGANQATFAADVATAVTQSDSPGYAVPGSAFLDATLYIPLGTQPGVSTDHHLTVKDPIHSREHDMSGVTYDSGTQRITGCAFGVSFPLGADQEPQPGNANAARFPLGRAIISAVDVASGQINHALVFNMANVGPAPCPYPANTSFGGAGTGLTFGAWMRLNPNVNPDTLTLNLFEKMVCRALQNYGMLCRDGGSNMTIHGSDRAGGAVNDADWSSLGITLDPGNANGLVLSNNMPWSSMQVLLPPGH